MRLLCVQPGASVSTADVYTGMVKALAAQGHEIVKYSLDARIENAGAFLNFVWKRTRRQGHDLPRPTPADVLYLACEGILHRALRHEVDGVVIWSGMYLHPDILVEMQRAHIRTALVLSESPYDDDQQARLVPFADVAFTNERTSVSLLRRFQPETHYLPHAYDPDLHRPDPPADIDERAVPAHDVVFVGSLFAERIEVLAAVDWTGIDLGLYGEHDLLGPRSKLRRHVRGGYVENAYAAALYRKAKIGLNLHRTSVGFGRRTRRVTHAESLNPRAYELAACGVFQISDYRAEVFSTFGQYVPTFRAAHDLGPLIRRYLDPDAESLRDLYAENTREYVYAHTFAARAATLMEHLDRVWFDRIPGITFENVVSGVTFQPAPSR